MKNKRVKNLPDDFLELPGYRKMAYSFSTKEADAWNAYRERMWLLADFIETWVVGNTVLRGKADELRAMIGGLPILQVNDEFGSWACSGSKIKSKEVKKMKKLMRGYDDD